MITRRILRWSVAGAVYAFLISIGTLQPGTLAMSVLVGAVTGAVGGGIASVVAPPAIQALITGAAVGICGSVLSYYLVGASRGFVSHLSIHTFAAVVAFLILRVGFGERRGEPIFATTQKT